MLLPSHGCSGSADQSLNLKANEKGHPSWTSLDDEFILGTLTSSPTRDTGALTN